MEGENAERFRNGVKEMNGIPWYGVFCYFFEFFVWLYYENCEKYYGADSKITASEKRILISHWCGNGYKKLTANKFDDFRYNLFAKTGYLIIGDGSEDSSITTEGLPDYAVPPVYLIPLMLLLKL